MFIFRIMSLSSYIPAHHHYTTVHWIQPTSPIISIIITHPVMRRRPSINQLQHFEMWKKTVHNIQFIRKLLLAAHRGNIAQMEMLFDGARFISCHSRNLKAEWLNAFSAYIRFPFWLDWHESSDWPEMGAHWWSAWEEIAAAAVIVQNPMPRCSFWSKSQLCWARKMEKN